MRVRRTTTGESCRWSLLGVEIRLELPVTRTPPVSAETSAPSRHPTAAFWATSPGEKEELSGLAS